MRREAPAIVLLAAAALVWTACGGGGGGGGGGPTTPPPTLPPAGITFTAGGTAGSNSLALSGGGTQTTLSLDIVAKDVTDLYGVSFDLQFPSGLLRFERAIEGNLLDRKGSFNTSMQVAEQPAGNLVVGVTRLGGAPGADGDGILVTLEFSALTTGSGSFQFLDNAGYDSGGAKQSGLSWVAGSVQVTQ